jgi:hypothetical protein
MIALGGRWLKEEDGRRRRIAKGGRAVPADESVCTLSLLAASWACSALISSEYSWGAVCSGQ